MTLSIVKKSTLKATVIFAALLGSLALTGCERKQENVVTPVVVPGSVGATEFSSASSAAVLDDQESSSSASSSSVMGDTGTTADGQ
jgi:hypothetical protein